MKALVALGLLAALSSARSASADDASYDHTRSRSELRRELRDVDRLGWYVPDFARLQTAGLLGSVGAGFGYAIFNDIVNLSLMYGYTPEARAGNNVHAARFAIDFRPFDVRINAFRLVPIYLGGSMLYGFGGEYFSRLPEHYARLEKGYYPPTALHWGGHLGLELDYVPGSGRIERHGLYYELVTIDTYVSSWVDNPSELGLTDVAASAIGYRCAF